MINNFNGTSLKKCMKIYTIVQFKNIYKVIFDIIMMQNVPNLQFIFFFIQTFKSSIIIYTNIELYKISTRKINITDP